MTFNSIQRGNNHAGEEFEEFTRTCQEKADSPEGGFRLPHYRVEVKDVQRGWARYTTGSITIPTWIAGTHPKYIFYYVMHEVIHFKFKVEGRWHEAHEQVFKDYEAECCEAWGVRLVFKGGTYPAYICDTAPFGEVVCGKRGVRTSVA